MGRNHCHAEFVSASMPLSEGVVQFTRSSACSEAWTLKQVQGDVVEEPAL
jgi:hypothetical protein